jgi:membrane fusion protein (multidrug efflux system)
MKGKNLAGTRSARRRQAAGLLLVVPLLLVLSLAGCRQEHKAAAPAVPVVEVVRVAQRDVPLYREWVGVLDGSVNAVIRPQVSGYLLRQQYREGDLVRKGQVLFEIDPRTFQATVNQARAALDQAKGDLARQEAMALTARADLARVRPLAAKNAVSKKDLDDAIGRELATRAGVEAARAGVAVAVANLDKAELDLGFTRITSPVDGIAGIAKTQLGNLVGPSMQEELTSVSTVDPIKVYINASEQEYLHFRTFGADRVRAMALTLVLADDRQVDPTTGTLKLGALFPNPDRMLRPGLYGRIRAQIEERQGALLIPQRAVTEVQGRTLVAVVGANSTVEVRPVQVGERIGGDWLIERGLAAGEQVVVEGVQKVRPGMTVTAKPYAPTPPAGAAPAAPQADKG